MKGAMNLTQFSNLLREVRLRRASDVVYRLYRGALKRTGVLRRQFPAVRPCEQDFLDALEPGVAANMGQFVEHLEQRPRPCFYFESATVEAVPADLRQTEIQNSPMLQSASRVRQRRFSSFAGPEVRFDGQVDWLHCMNGDGRWPTRHWTQIDYRGYPELGDVKACWEWNRHHSFVTLGRAYRHTGDERYVDEFVSLSETWCRQNPPEVGINYTSNLEIGLRIVSWLWAHHLMSPSPHYTEEARGRLHLFLFYMARHLAKNLTCTVFTGRNNHLIGDSSCLAVWCILYPEVKSSRRWLERSLRVLWQSLEEQVYPDGMHFELSFGYHQFVMEFVLQVVLLLRKQDQGVPPSVMTRLESMCDALARVVQPNGEPPNFNDNDDGFVWALHDSPRQRVASLLQLGAKLFERPDLWPRQGSAATETTYWLLGRDHCQQPTNGNNDRPETVGCFPNAGIYVLRSHDSQHSHYAMINNHPDPFPNSGHNHASLLQLLLWVEGAPVLIDGGTYRYGSDDGFRNTLRGTHAHNTVVVDGRDQALPIRDFGWLSKLRPVKTLCQDSEHAVVFDGVHDSYAHLAQPVRHRRSLVWIKDPCVWIVRDELTGAGSHEFRQMWHFPGDIEVEKLGNGAVQVRSPTGVTVGIQCLAEHDDRLEVERGSKENKWSWESPRYGVVRPRTSLSVIWTDVTPTSRVTAFYPISTAPVGELPIERAGKNQLSLWDDDFVLDFGRAIANCTASKASSTRSGHTYCPVSLANRVTVADVEGKSP